MSYIHKIGVELEGGWNKPEESWKNFFSVSHIVKDDGSIYLNDEVVDTRTGQIDSSVSGTFVSVYQTDPKYISPWREPGEAITKIKAELASEPFINHKDLIQWIEEWYPHYVNDTCGFHIHMSFTSLYLYALLAKPKFHTYFRSKMKRWASKNLPEDHLFWDRFRGSNSYCSERFNASAQLRFKGGSRYTNLNFDSYHSHKTIENRLFPMFEKKELAISALTEYIYCVESFIHSEKDKFFTKSKENVIRVCV